MEQKKKVIGTTTYLVTQMDAVSALKVQTKLIKILGVGALEFIGNKNKPDTSKLASMVPTLLANFDDELVNQLVLSLFDKGVFTEVNGLPKVVDFATHFSGKFAEMWEVVAFILEANFAMGESSGSSSLTTEKENEKQES